MSGIILIGIAQNPSEIKDRPTPKYLTFIYQLLGGSFFIGLVIIHTHSGLVLNRLFFLTPESLRIKFKI